MQARTDSWMVITGAGSGLGREFARLAAAQGMNLILTGRDGNKLAAICQELSTAPIAVHTLIADLSIPEQTTDLLRRIDALRVPVDYLINNAGAGRFGSFLDFPPKDLTAEIRLNVESPLRLLRHLIQPMAARGRGGVLQVASYAGLQPIPRYTAYSAAKAHWVAFFDALTYELRKSPLKLSLLAPGFMETGFHTAAGHAHSPWMQRLSLPAEQVAAIGWRDWQRGRRLITPGWWYRLNNVLQRLLPRAILPAISAAMVRLPKHQAAVPPAPHHPPVSKRENHHA